MDNPGKRQTILSDAERQDLYGVPDFSPEERDYYFSLDSREMRIMKKMGKPRSKVYFILQLGYFKARNTFPPFKFEDVKDDVQYIIATYFSREKGNFKGSVCGKYLKSYQRSILELLKFKSGDASTAEQIKKKAAGLSKLQPDPFYIFSELLSFFEREKIVLPAYSLMQKIIGRSILNEKLRLETVINRHIPEYAEKALNDLLGAEDVIFRLTELKKDPKKFSHGEMSREIEKIQIHKRLYRFTKHFLPKLKISPMAIKYYAELTDHFDAFRLKSMNTARTYLHLLCFVYHRCQKINDNMINGFNYFVINFLEECRCSAKDMVYEYKTESNETLRKSGRIFAFFTDKSVPDIIPFGNVRKNAFAIVPRDKFPMLSRYVSNTVPDEREFRWNYFDKIKYKIVKNARPLFRNIEFESSRQNEPLIKAVKFLKKAFDLGKPLSRFKTRDFPAGFIKKDVLKYIFGKKREEIELKSSREKKYRTVKVINADRYEFLVYMMLRKNLEAGDIFCTNSTLFRNLEDYLISRDEWRKNKDKILEEIDFPKIKLSAETRLAELKSELEEKWITVNQRIENGENKGIKITNEGNDIKWTLPYKKMKEKENSLLFDCLPQVSIRDVLHFANEHSGFLKAFKHIKPRYAKQKPDKSFIIACIVADGTCLGIFKMSEICDIIYDLLDATSNNYIRMETLRKASDFVSNLIASLPVFKRWNLKEGVLHGSIDGQKFETKREIIKARRSSKYFFTQGVVDLSMVINNVPVNCKLIGSNERESFSIFDITYNNTSEIDPLFLSGDTHTVNKLNFAFLDVIDKKFVPRYTKINRKKDKLYGFKPLNCYKGLIKPTKKVTDNLIVEEWDNMKRIWASLLRKETTQSIIVRKFNSSAKSNRTKRAFWEFNNILMTLHVLECIDNPLMRQYIQRSLNRGESYHSLRRSIAFENDSKFRGSTIRELEIWNECARLLANCIVLYNSVLLSQLLEYYEKRGNQKAVEIIKRTSPFACKNINFRGTYEFRKGGKNLNINELVEIMLKNFEAKV